MNIVALRTLVWTLSALVTAPALVSAARADSDAQNQCHVGVLAAPAEFPLGSQKNSEHGTVRVLLRVDAQGRAVSAITEQSSGYARLDRAAVHSVLNEWRFDVSSCAEAKFPLTKQVDVEYRRAPIATLSVSISSKRSAALADARSNPSCFTHFASSEHNGEFSVACVGHPKNSLQSPSSGRGEVTPLNGVNEVSPQTRLTVSRCRSGSQSKVPPDPRRAQRQQSQNCWRFFFFPHLRRFRGCAFCTFVVPLANVRALVETLWSNLA